MTADRWSGLFFMALGIVLYAVVIPWQVETVDYGWLKPRTLPRILALVMVLGGMSLLLWPVGDAAPRYVPWRRSGMFAAVLIVGLWAIAKFGFVVVAPVLALVLMGLAHERRPLWLLLGAAGLPLAIWFAVAVLLERPLP
jgi:putative tricarboxylic transport membrane protein